MNKYTVFIDESGTKELDDYSQPLYCLCATLVSNQSLDRYKIFLDKYLTDCFKGNQPELKSNWMRNPKEREKHYLSPFDITEEDFKDFTETFYDIFRRMRSSWVIASIINKRFLKANYKKPFNPNAIAYELLMQRIANFSTQYSSEVEIKYDDFPEGKTKAGNKWKDLLIQQHSRLSKGKTMLNKHWTDRDKMDFKCLPEEIEFLDSKDHIFLQISDLCAYNITRRTREVVFGQKQEAYWGYKQIRDRIHGKPGNINTKKNYGIIVFPDKLNTH